MASSRREMSWIVVWSTHSGNILFVAETYDATWIFFFGEGGGGTEQKKKERTYTSLRAFRSNCWMVGNNTYISVLKQNSYVALRSNLAVWPRCFVCIAFHKYEPRFVPVSLSAVQVVKFEMGSTECSLIWKPQVTPV